MPESNDMSPENYSEQSHNIKTPRFGKEGRFNPQAFERQSGGKKFEPSWLVRNENELGEIKNDSLKRRISRLHETAKTPELLSREQWTDEYRKLMHDADDKEYAQDQEIIDDFLLKMNKGIQAMDEKRKEGVSGEKRDENPPSGFVDQLAEAIHGKSLSQNEKYMALQNNEEWNNSPLEPINPNAAPGYYVDMSEEQRQLHEIRIELANACYIKRSKLSAPTLEAMSKEIPYAGLSKSETERLYNGMPGVKQAVKAYIDLLDGNGAGGNENALFKAKGRDTLLTVRASIRQSIEKFVLPKITDRDNLETRCRDAEQIAFNLLFLGNVFESLDSKWENDDKERVRAPQITSELLLVPIKNSMKPLDNLIASLSKPPEEFSPVGRFGEWAYRQTVSANGGRSVELGLDKPNHVERVVIVPEIKGNEKKFWTLGDQGRTLNVPECYPVKLIGSVFEETKVKINGEKVELVDLIRQSQDGSIPWESVEGEGMWGTYGFRLGKAGAIWDILQGKNLVKWGDNDSMRQWVEAANGALSQFGLVKEAPLKRWMLYASTGIKVNNRPPILSAQGRRLDILSSMGSKNANYLPNKDLLFPWDRGIYIF